MDTTHFSAPLHLDLDAYMDFLVSEAPQLTTTQASSLAALLLPMAGAVTQSPAS
ncbi:hypothetical protein [Cryobacterium gelidum]|jgi:hypothetical protein|uniref:hypothetical protein n=1 Tax=Cryobacterium gelidum TaxID=1259164 RepID=UPI00141AF3A5|nr:hypothetical protein [Cryobacterium gelidum]